MTPLSASSPLPLTSASTAQKGRHQQEEIETAARDFEAMFIAEMMKPLFEGISVDAPFGGGKGEEVFRGMLLQEYGKIVASRGGFGLAEPVRAQMILMQGMKNKAPTPSMIPPLAYENLYETQN
ncbi:MAG: rod-binding protein [Alphaproteobacteria bacterium]|nr:rod-binding protein [Alphaproteobacteria bacterium]